MSVPGLKLDELDGLGTHHHVRQHEFDHSIPRFVSNQPGVEVLSGGRAMNICSTDSGNC